MPTPALYDTLHSFKDIHNVVLSLAEDLSDEQLNWKPRPESWSVGQCLDHLAVINPFYLSHFIPLVDRARTAPAGSFRGLSSTPPGNWFVALLEPPVAVPGFTIVAVWHERSHRSPGHRWLRGLLAEACGEPSESHR